MLMICKESHLDHDLTMEQLRWVLDRFADKSGFFIETLTLPEDLGSLPCGLYGPLMGDEPVSEAQVYYKARGGREWTSRLVKRELRQVQQVTVIAGPHEGHDCVLYTVYGGPCAPQEPGDPGVMDPEASEAFWREHALAE